MSQRQSGYARKPRDLYETPPWVTHALIDSCLTAYNKPEVWEPAAGNNSMVRPLREAGFKVHASDIAGRSDVAGGGVLMQDFLTATSAPAGVRAVITNPPFRMAEKFATKGLELMEERQGIVALLLRIDFDSASTRTHLFRDCPAWWRKIVLLKRIVWFKSETGNGPSENHAWFVWNWDGCCEEPTIGYAP